MQSSHLQLPHTSAPYINADSTKTSMILQRFCPSPNRLHLSSLQVLLSLFRPWSLQTVKATYVCIHMLNGDNIGVSVFYGYNRRQWVIYIVYIGHTYELQACMECLLLINIIWLSFHILLIPTYIVNTCILAHNFRCNFCGWRQPQAFPLNEILVMMYNNCIQTMQDSV